MILFLNKYYNLYKCILCTIRNNYDRNEKNTMNNYLVENFTLETPSGFTFTFTVYNLYSF